MTYYALAAAGIGKYEADNLAHFSSVYADNPGSNINTNNAAHPLDKHNYRRGINYNPTSNSQVINYKGGDDYNYNIWHSMRSPWEKENKTISEADAMTRGLEFGWSKIFESSKSGKLNDLVRGNKGMRAFGQGMHALQDAFAHKGNGDPVGAKHALNDRFNFGQDFQDAKDISETAVSVHNLLSENWGALDKSGVKLTNTEGMTSKQISNVFTQISKYLSQKNKDDE